jgi:two-component system KDP operon response regulator KdpE
LSDIRIPALKNIRSGVKLTLLKMVTVRRKDKHRVLVIEDDPCVKALLQSTLSDRGWRVILASDGDIAGNMILKYRPHLIILDLRLPGKSGFQILRELREWSKIPVIVLTAFQDSETEVTCLNLGADDYVSKPIEIDLLLAHIKTVMGHCDQSKGIDQTYYCLGALEIDTGARRVSVNGREVILTPTEYAILNELLINRGKVLTHSSLLEKIWGPAYRNDTNYLHVFMNHLRDKIGCGLNAAYQIVNVARVGYRFDCQDLRVERRK